jgi:hypothetical protein
VWVLALSGASGRCAADAGPPLIKHRFHRRGVAEAAAFGKRETFPGNRFLETVSRKRFPWSSVMTREEAQRVADNPTNRQKFERARSSYVKLRDSLMGTTATITRRMWRKEFGGRMSDLLEYAEPIEVLESDKGVSAPPLMGVLPQQLQIAFADLQKLLEKEWHVLGADEHRRFQELALQDKARSDALLQKAYEKIADLEAAGREAGAESRDSDAIREKLKTVETERDTVVAKMTALSTDNSVLREKVASTSAQIAQFIKTEEMFTQECSRQLAEREKLVRDAERAKEFKADADRLRHRLDAELTRHRAQLEDLRTAHAREIADFKAHVETQCKRIEVLEAGVFRVLNDVVAQTVKRDAE